MIIKKEYRSLLYDILKLMLLGEDIGNSNNPNEQTKKDAIILLAYSIILLCKKQFGMLNKDEKEDYKETLKIINDFTKKYEEVMKESK